MAVESRIKSLSEIRERHAKKVSQLSEERQISKAREWALHVLAAIFCGLGLGWALTMMVATGVNSQMNPGMAAIISISLCFILQIAGQKCCGNRIVPVIFTLFFFFVYSSSISTLALIFFWGKKFGF